MKALTTLVVTLLVLSVLPAVRGQEGETEIRPEETALLARWDELANELKHVKSRLGVLQIRYNGTEDKTRRDAVEAEYNKLCADYIEKVKKHLANVETWLKAHPDSMAVRERRAMDEVFTWADSLVRARDCEILFKKTENIKYLERAAKYHEQGYRPRECADTWARIIAIAPSVDAHYNHGTALMNALDFGAALKTFEAGLSLAKEDKERRKMEAAVQFARDYVKDWPREQKLREEARTKNNLPVVEIETDRGSIVLELFEDDAPNTVANFIVLAEKGFYDNGTFHRCIANFMIQGGDPLGTGRGGPGYRIADECKGDSCRLHYPGSISMAKSAGQENSGGSQFFITSSVAGPLNGRHTVFGRVLQGIELTHVKAVDVSKTSLPFKIKSVKVLKKRDHEYKVEKIQD